MKFPFLVLPASFILTSARGSEIVSSQDSVSSSTSLTDTSKTGAEGAVSSTSVESATWFLRTVYPNGCESKSHRITEGWRMNVCPGLWNWGQWDQYRLRYTCTRPAGGGPWTLYSNYYSCDGYYGYCDESYNSCNGWYVDGHDSFNGFGVGDGECVNGVSFSCAMDLQPPEMTAYSPLRTEWYFKNSGCDGNKNDLYYFKTQNPYTYNPADIISCRDRNGNSGGYNDGRGFQLAQPSHYRLKTQQDAKPPSQCPRDVNSLGTSVRLSRNKWVTDTPPPPTASKVAVSSDASKTAPSTVSTPEVSVASSSVSTTTLPPSSTRVCNNFNVMYHNLLSIKSVVESASPSCLNLLLNLETNRNTEANKIAFDPMNKFVTITIRAEGTGQQLYEQRRSLFTNGDLVTSLTPFSIGVKSFRVQLQVDFSIEGVEVPSNSGYFVEVKISYEDESNVNNDIDCVALHH